MSERRTLTGSVLTDILVGPFAGPVVFIISLIAFWQLGGVLFEWLTPERFNPPAWSRYAEWMLAFISTVTFFGFALRKKTAFITAACVAVVVTSLPVLALIWWGESMEGTGPDIIAYQAVESPNKTLVARMFVVSGGGAAGYTVYYVNIQKQGEPLYPCRNIVVSGRHEPGINLRWLPDGNLVVKAAANDDVDLERGSFGSVRVTLERHPALSAK